MTPGDAAKDVVDRPLRRPRRLRHAPRAEDGRPGLADRDGRGASAGDVSKADAAIDRAAERLRDLSDRLDERGGVSEKLAEPLAEDADFLPKLKPSLVEERLKENPTGSEPPPAAPSPPRPAPFSGGRRTRKAPSGKDDAGGSKALPLVAGAFGAGVLLAKVIDWRGHAHPRD